MVCELIELFLSSLENRDKVPWKMLEQKYTLPSGVHIMAWDFCTLQHSFKTMSSNDRLSSLCLGGGREELALLYYFPSPFLILVFRQVRAVEYILIVNKSMCYFAELSEEPAAPPGYRLMHRGRGCPVAGGLRGKALNHPICSSSRIHARLCKT